MARRFPSHFTNLDNGTDPRVFTLTGDGAANVFETLANDTARTILESLHGEPRTASELAELTEASLQTVLYHLNKLQAAGLVEVGETTYSERGSEMKIYTAVGGPLVVAGDTERAQDAESLLGRLLGVLALLGGASVAVQWLIERYQAQQGPSGPGELPPGPMDMPPQPVDPLPMPPGALFFLGGLLALGVLFGWQRYCD